MILKMIGSRNGALVALSLAGVLTCVSGCGETKTNTVANTPAAKNAEAKVPAAAQPAVANTAAKPDDEHAHKPGAHGGIIMSIGVDNYHAEAIVEKSGKLRLLMLGKDESRVQDVETQTVPGYVKAAGDADSESFELTAEPQPGDAAGKTSQFVGQLPAELVGKQLDVTIPSLRINGERFRIGFSTKQESHAEEPMPMGVVGDDERKLYLTPGGIYTEDDIKANGGKTARERFKGVISSHNMKPKAGDKICPITQTKANPKFTWVVGGKSYEFCCPPCVDEFVKTAKEQPEMVQAPDTYIKRQ